MEEGRKRNLVWQTQWITCCFRQILQTFFGHIWHLDVEQVRAAMLGFVDDYFLLANSLPEMRCMLSDSGNELYQTAALDLKKLKLEYMINYFVDDANQQLCFDGALVARVNQLTCLGSVIRTDMNEQPCVLHRTSKSWGTFHKWKDILLCQQVTIANRLAFWAKTVQPSLLWGLETTRLSKKCQDIMKQTQRHMIIKLLRKKRRKENDILEPWLDYHIRVSRDAKTLLVEFPQFDIVKQLQKKKTFAGHIFRFGMEQREEHLVKHILLWRNAYWWYYQRKHIQTCFKHAKVGKIARWEHQFPRNWITQLSFSPAPS